MSLRGALALIGLMLFIAANGTPAAAGRTSPLAPVLAGPPAPAAQMQAEQEDDAEPTAQPDAAPSQAEQEDDAEPTAQPDGDGIPVAPLLTPDGRLQLDGTVQGPLDLDGWQVTLDPDDGLVFRPEAVSGTWSHLGQRALPALNGVVYAVAISGTEVLVGGSFTNAGGVAGANKVARWDGSQWHALGAPYSFSSSSFEEVRTLVVSGTEVLAGGSFTNAGGVSGANKVAKLSGGTWGLLGAPYSFSSSSFEEVRTLVVSGTEVLAGGSFTNAGGVSGANKVAKLSGGTWGLLGAPYSFSSSFFDVVSTLALSGTEVLAGGSFTNAGGVSGANSVAKLSGGTWGALGPTNSINSTVFTLALSGTEVLAGGSFTNAGGVSGANKVAKLSGGTWGALGPTNAISNTVRTLVVSGTEVLAGGEFINAGGVSGANNVAKLSGGTWGALGATNSITGTVYTLVVSGTEVLAGGDFFDAGGVSGANKVAKLSGGTWGALGGNGGIDSALDNSVYTVVISGTEVLAGGSFTNAGGVAGANKVARWDGSQWHALGAPYSFSGSYYEAVPYYEAVRTLVVSGTEVLAGGYFFDAGGVSGANNVAKLSGGTWGALGPPNSITGPVYTLVVSGTEVLAGGYFFDAGGVSGANNVAKLSGGTWGALGPPNSITGTVNTLVVSGTEVLAGGNFTNAGGNPNADYLARLSGGSWGALGTTPLNNTVYAIAVGSGGVVFAGGAFVNAGGVPEADYVARWDGSQWRALGGSGGVGAFAPVGGSFPVVYSLAVSGNNLYVGGFFWNVAGIAAADYLAVWDGSTWSDVGGSGSLSALNSGVQAIAVGANNDLYIGGWFTDAAGNDLADHIVRFQPQRKVYLPLVAR